MRHITILALILTALSVWAVSSCKEEPGRKLTMSEKMVVKAVGDEWQARGLPWDDSSCGDTEELSVLIADDQILWDYCFRCPPGTCGPEGNPDCPYGCAYGCLSDYKLIVSHEDTNLCSIIVHEAIHWIHACTGLDGDPFHEGWFWGPVSSTVREQYCQTE